MKIATEFTLSIYFVSLPWGCDQASGELSPRSLASGNSRKQMIVSWCCKFVENDNFRAVPRPSWFPKRFWNKDQPKKKWFRLCMQASQHQQHQRHSHTRKPAKEKIADAPFPPNHCIYGFIITTTTSTILLCWSKDKKNYCKTDVSTFGVLLMIKSFLL